MAVSKYYASTSALGFSVDNSISSMMTGFSNAISTHLDGLVGLLTAPDGLMAVADKNGENVFGVEGLYSQEYSIGIFAFLVLSMLVFVGIMYLYWKKSKTAIKPGEVVMFGAILMGVIIACVFGYLQMVEGYLF
jgi:hypothetical protein